MFFGLTLNQVLLIGIFLHIYSFIDQNLKSLLDDLGFKIM